MSGRLLGGNGGGVSWGPGLLPLCVGGGDPASARPVPSDPAPGAQWHSPAGRTWLVQSRVGHFLSAQPAGLASRAMPSASRGASPPPPPSSPGPPPPPIHTPAALQLWPGSRLGQSGPGSLFQDPWTWRSKSFLLRRPHCHRSDPRPFAKHISLPLSPTPLAL